MNAHLFCFGYQLQTAFYTQACRSTDVVNEYVKYYHGKCFCIISFETAANLLIKFLTEISGKTQTSAVFLYNSTILHISLQFSNVGPSVKPRNSRNGIFYMKVKFSTMQQILLYVYEYRTLQDKYQSL